MESTLVASDIKINGLITSLAVEEFETHSSFDEMLPEEVISLFCSVAPEFTDSELQYAFDSEESALYFSIAGLKASFSVFNTNQWVNWAQGTKTDSFVLRASLPSSYALTPLEVLEFNKLHPSLKFYLTDGVVIVEEAYYLAHGVPVLNLLDRVYSFLNNVNNLPM